MAQIFQSMLMGSMMSETGGRKMGGVSAKRSQKDLVILKELMEAGKVVPVIDRRYPLSEAAEALRYMGEDMPEESSNSHGKQQQNLTQRALVGWDSRPFQIFGMFWNNPLAKLWCPEDWSAVVFGLRI